MNWSRFLLMTLLTTVPFFTNAQDKVPKKITSVEGITEYQLDNGLKVLLFPDPSKQTITVNITYLVGSRHENYGETGMAHLLEHLVFKGTPDHPDIPKELSDHGARPNGTTWLDRTNYFETFAATEENLRWALDLESDRMINSYIAQKDLDSEMTVVRNEYEAGENYPTSVLQKRMLSAAYSWHNYGNTTIGARSDIENVRIENLQAFYRKYYQPDNAVLMVSGKIDEEATLKLVQEYFGDIPRPERKLYPTYTEEPTQDGERFVKLERTGDVQAFAALYHIPSSLHPDASAIEVLLETLTHRPSGRLYKNLIEAQKASQVYAYAFPTSEPGIAYFSGTVLKEKSLEDAQNTFLATLDSLASNPITEEEVERAKRDILKNIELQLTNTEQVGVFMSNFIATGDWRMLFIRRDRIEAATAEDVNRVAQYYLKPSNRTLGQFLPADNPDRVEIPRTPDLKTLVEGYKGREAMAQGEAFDPSPANIQARTNRGSLANGMKYSLLAKETKGNVVTATIGVRFGNEKTLKGKRTAASIAPGMLNKGTSTKSRQEIQDLFDQYKAQVNFYGSEGKSFIGIKTTRENFENTLRLSLEILKDPSFPEDEFQTLIQQQIASIEQFKSEPFSKASTALSEHMNIYPKDHILYAESPEEEIASLKALTVDDVKAFYEEFYGGGESSTITIVGEFDEGNVKDILTNELGDWKTERPYTRPPMTTFNGEPLNTDVKTPDKTNAVFLAVMELEMSDQDPDYPALFVGNYLLGGGFLNSRLATRIRQKEGLSYGVGSFFSADGKERSATFGAQAIYNPENKAKVEKAFFEEIQKVIDEGFTQEELDAAKKGLLQSNLVTRAQDSYLVTTLNNNMIYERDMTYYEKFDKNLEALTLDDVNAAFRKYVKPEKLCVVKAGDWKEEVKKP